MKVEDELLALEICHLAMKTMPVDIKEHLDISDQVFNDLFMEVHQKLNPEDPPDQEDEYIDCALYYKEGESYDLT